MNDREREALLVFYREIDAALSALAPDGCAACGECCRFDKADHILYASRLERELLEEAERPEKSDASPILLARGLACPFLVAGRCRAREARTLGCRVHFCDAVPRSPDADFSEQWHGRLKRMHETLGTEWDYRPLLPLSGRKYP